MEVTMEQVLGQLNRTEPDYEQAARLGPEALPLLSRLVQGGDPRLASRATWLAGFINTDQSVSVLEEAARSSDPVVRIAAAGSLRNLSELPAPLANDLLSDQDNGVRLWTLKALESHRPGDFKTQVEQIAANDPKEELREIAGDVANQLP
jgi:HEAT repeat protein